MRNQPTEHDALLSGVPEAQRDQESYARRLLSVPAAIIPISLFSFGGPPAHLALAHDHFVCTCLAFHSCASWTRLMTHPHGFGAIHVCSQEEVGLG